MALNSAFDADETKLRAAMKVVTEHMLRIHTADRDALLIALAVMRDHYETPEWVCYVP